MKPWRLGLNQRIKTMTVRRPRTNRLKPGPLVFPPPPPMSFTPRVNLTFVFAATNSSPSPFPFTHSLHQIPFHLPWSWNWFPPRQIPLLCWFFFSGVFRMPETSALCFSTFSSVPRPKETTSTSSSSYSSSLSNPSFPLCKFPYFNIRLPRRSLRFVAKSSGSGNFLGDDAFGHFPWESPDSCMFFNFSPVALIPELIFFPEDFFLVRSVGAFGHTELNFSSILLLVQLHSWCLLYIQRISLRIKWWKFFLDQYCSSDSWWLGY